MNPYQYYAQVAGWGTDKFRFGAPPQPAFRPLSNWSGIDYYEAYTPGYDRALFERAWDRVRDPAGFTSLNDIGARLEEARLWHQRAYGGMGRLEEMAANELGHAAAYEALRIWMHHSFLQEPFREDLERQREGLIGLAVGEVVRLSQGFQASWEESFLHEATEVAAETASALFLSLVRNGHYYQPYPNGYYSGSNMYAFDDHAFASYLRPLYAYSNVYNGYSSYYPTTVSTQPSYVYPASVPGTVAYSTPSAVVSPYTRPMVGVPYSYGYTVPQYSQYPGLAYQAPYRTGVYPVASQYYYPRRMSIAGHGGGVYPGYYAGGVRYATPMVYPGSGYISTAQVPVAAGRYHHHDGHRHHRRTRSC